jgi:hypothetical protein
MKLIKLCPKYFEILHLCLICMCFLDNERLFCRPRFQIKIKVVSYCNSKIERILILNLRFAFQYIALNVKTHTTCDIFK